MSRRSQHAAAWIVVQAIFALSGAIGLFVGVNNARCGVPSLLPSRNGPFGNTSGNGLEFHTLHQIGQWGIVLGMAAATAAVLFGMFVSWKNRIHVRTLLVLMALSAAQFAVTVTVWSIQIENQAFCGLDLPTVATSILTAALMAITIVVCASKSKWSSADLTGVASPPNQPAPRQPEHRIDEQSVSGPFIIQMAGHGGVGKSTVAQALASRLDASVIDLDVIKTDLLDAGVSWDAASAGSYATIYRLVDELLAASGPIIIVDTPSYWPEIHERLTAAADRYGARYAFVECTASRATRSGRLGARTPLRSQVDDADTNPRDAPGDLSNVHDREIARPSGRALFQVDTERDVDIDAVISLLVGTTAN